MSYKVNVLFNKDVNGYYVYCPDLPGCQSEGNSFEEAKANIKEAIELYLETMNAEEINEALNKEFITTIMEVNVA